MEAKQPKGKDIDTTTAVRLLAKVRDIHDELQMLREIGKHQMRVWKKLEKRNLVDGKRWESHIISDIEDMIKSTDRIKSNVRSISGVLGFAEFYAIG